MKKIKWKKDGIFNSLVLGNILIGYVRKNDKNKNWVCYSCISSKLIETNLKCLAKNYLIKELYEYTKDLKKEAL